MLAANLFSQFASDTSQVALMVNLLSALLSAGCIFFLFLTITHLARELICPALDGMTMTHAITIETCGVVGALAYTFSDTFWFSAVEAEVYAFSSFLTALMFWLILKWSDNADEPRADRWMILIAYITGLSIGVHLLCLLCLPAMSFVVYFRKAKRVTKQGLVKTLLAGILLVGSILYGLIPGVVTIGGWSELLFTNVMGCAYNTGLVCYIVLLTGTLITLYYKVQRRVVKLSLACVLMTLAGYSSYGVIFIRANARLPMCENAPDNIFSLGSYLNREQYGKTPLFYGPAYCSELDREAQGDYLVPIQKEGKAICRPVADSTKQAYEVVRHDIDYVYQNNMYFPRMHSARHAQAYEDWLGGVEKENGIPTMAENLRFFLSYQVNFMYWRYFLWNFVGRQNNIQGNGEVEHGNWITGFRWIGLGVGGLASRFKYLSVASILIPLQMGSQTWDDHDRSGRYACRDFGANYLESMQREGHPIIFTDGDNETFPLWYNHEVEGLRTDTRDCNLEYLQTDWYIDQMKRPAYDSPALPVGLNHEDYKEGRLEYVPIDFDSLTIGNTVISLEGKQGLYKNELMALEILSQANWERPVYLSVSLGPSHLTFLRDHLVLEGLAYRVSPTATGQQVDVERLYNNIMHRFRYGGLNTKGIYVDEDVRRMANAHQLVMGVLIDSLLRQGDLHRALMVCQKWQKELPPENVPYTDSALAMARCYYLASQPEQADEIVGNLLRRSAEWLSWIDTITPRRRAGSSYSQYEWAQTLQKALAVAGQFNRTELSNQYIQPYEHFIK